MRNAGNSNSTPPPQRWLPALCIAAAGALTGCSYLHTTGGTGALLKAEERAILVMERADPAAVKTVTRRKEWTYGTPQGGTVPAQPATGQKAESPQDGQPAAAQQQLPPAQNITHYTEAHETARPATRYVACAEPSPDVMTAYAAQFAAGLSKTTPEGGKMSAEAKAALQQAAAFIGMRTPSIQLLRDAMYRVCEAYANGAVDSDQYELFMRRYQRQIVAMMAIESLAQVGRAPAITLTTQASTGGERALSEWMAEIKTQQELQDKHQKVADAKGAESKQLGEEIEGLEKDLGKDGLKDADKQALQKKLTAAKEAQQKADTAKKAAEAEVRWVKARIASLQDHMAGGASLTGRTAAEVAQATATTSAQLVEAAAPTVLQIASRVLDVDDTAALCFIHYKREPKEPQGSALRGLCDTHMKYMQDVRDVRTKVLDACVKKAGDDGDKLGRCVGLATSLSKDVMATATTLPIAAQTFNAAVETRNEVLDVLKQLRDAEARKKAAPAK